MLEGIYNQLFSRKILFILKSIKYAIKNNNNELDCAYSCDN